MKFDCLIAKTKLIFLPFIFKLDLNIKQVKDINEFCEKFMCFYESVTYHSFEDYGESFKSHEVGEIYPKMFSKLCRMFDVNYELLNCKYSI